MIMRRPLRAFGPLVRTAVWVLLLLAPALAAAQEFRARVVGVDDGDTVRVLRGQGDVRIRIFGIDAPEATQPFGPEARELARRLLLDQTVVVSMKSVDQYGRLVAALVLNGRDVGAELIAAGAAWNYAQFSQDDRLATLEAGARRARRGMWALGHPQAPWLYRAAARAGGSGSATSSGAPTATGLFHGNQRSRVFHAPGCQQYDCANCTVPFESAVAAAAAGYRAHTVCVR